MYKPHYKYNMNRSYIESGIDMQKIEVVYLYLCGVRTTKMGVQ